MDELNAYEYLEIRETATNEEIIRALEEHIEEYCNGSDGEYLREIFMYSAELLLNPSSRFKIDKARNMRKISEEIERDIACLPEKESNTVLVYECLGVEETAKLLLDPETRSQVNEERKKKNMKSEKTVQKESNRNKATDSLLESIDDNYVHYRYNSRELNKNIISSVNTELLSKVLVLSKRSPLEKMVSLNILYGVFGEDNSFTFAKEGVNYFDSRWYLKSITDKHKLIQNYETIWDGEQVFNSNGINYIPILASKIIPDEMVINGKVSTYELAALSTAIKKYLSANPEFISESFSGQIQNIKTKK